jgi:Protein of unknown function (DUF3040)
VDTDRSDDLTVAPSKVHASPATKWADRRPSAGDPKAKLVHLERCLEHDPALARRFRTLERRHQRNDVAVIGLLVMSVILLGAALATASWTCFVAGATTLVASFVVDTRYQRALERGLDREEQTTWP